jgi:zinc transport system permease protein
MIFQNMELLQYTFFRHALLGALFISLCCGIIGTYVVTRRRVFIAGGITHASLGGLGLGVFLGINPTVTAVLLQH